MKKKSKLSLWYDKEAAVWEEALPLGNGRIGAMVFSGVAQERLSLNDDTLWSGYPKDHNLAEEEGTQHYKTAQTLAMEGKYKEAQEYIETHMLGKNTERYLPMTDLVLDFDNKAEPIYYRRELDLETAVHTLTYVQGTVEYKRETFISAPRQIMFMRLTSSKRKMLNFTASFESKLPYGVSVCDALMQLEGWAEWHDQDDPSKMGMSFINLVDFYTDGKVISHDESVEIQNATEAVLMLCCRTNFLNPLVGPGKDDESHGYTALGSLGNVSGFKFNEFKDEHIKDYQSLFNRVELSFGAALDLPTPERLNGWDKPENDPGLYELLFQYGRYLMIAGSRPGTQPLNLQGIWNPHFYPPWSSNYTININAEMNYWPAEVANLAECHTPLLDFIKYLRITGAKTAKNYYNARGYTAHHNTDIWAMSTPVETAEGGARWAFWPLGAGWLSAHIMQHYDYSMNKKFLADAFPGIRDAARFFLDVMIEDADGTLIFAPSTSPENDFVHADGNYSVAKTATMTTAIIKETLQNTIRACDILCTEPEIKAEAEQALAKLPPYKIGTEGQLLEWSEELPEHEPTHRHTSHLYPLFPGNEIEHDTDLARACAITLEKRGPESTGWALAWRICLYARLRMAEHTFTFLQKQVRPCEGWRGGCYPNMFGSHPPFQIDSNFGATAGIAELLIQSTPGKVRLLPALPKALNTGYVKGLRIKGGITVSMGFEDGKLTYATFVLDTLPPCDLVVEYEGKETTLELFPAHKVSL